MNHGGEAAAPTAFTSIHEEIIKSHILNKLDGKSLASTSCVSTEFKSLSNGEILWKTICSNHFPSSLNPLVQTNMTNHRLFFSDVSSAVHHLPLTPPSQRPKIKNLVSAVDIFYEDEVVFSRVINTESCSSWFSCSPFKIDILEAKEVFPTNVKITGDDQMCMAALEKGMKLSWIMIDGDSKKALNVSSLCPVAVRRNWLGGEIQIRYAMVVPDSRYCDDGEALVQCGVVVSYREGEEMQVKELSLIVEDSEGLILDGNEGLAIVQEVINGERGVKNSDEERERYEKFINYKSDLTEMKLDMFVVFTGVSLFLSLCMVLLKKFVKISSSIYEKYGWPVEDPG
ncbi:hypothetical protein LIER_24073 [Lithospermum erythrorhizon]|uniref:F-box domain-containing protein n=1 Tax=Lithospermum erythrorhizon TaxID=34254 RepID=A0AAV3R5G9_LITER